jgi:dodecin
MSVAKIIELTSTSEVSFEDAVKQGVARAAETIEDITGAWVKDHSVRVSGGEITEYKVTMKVTFIVNEAAKTKGKSR